MKLRRDVRGRDLVRALCQRWGYVEVHQTGSHVILETETPAPQRISVPAHDALRLGTLNAILRSVAAHKLAQARKLETGSEREGLLTEAEGIDARARDRSPLDPVLWAELGRLHSVQAQWLGGGPQAAAALFKAREELAHASRLRPRFAPFLVEEAITAAVGGDFTSAARFAEQAANLNPDPSTLTLLSKIRSAQAAGATAEPSLTPKP